MVQSYEELVGGLGRAVNFRPERYRARELVQDYPPELWVADRSYRLHDLAMNGISFSVPEGDNPFRINDEHELVLRIGDRDVYCGRARVARVEQTRRGARVGMQLLTGFIDVLDLVDQHEAMVLRHQLDGGFAELRRGLPADYRGAIEQLTHFVHYYARALGHHESRLRSRSGDPAPAIDELVEESLEALRAPWTGLRHAAAEAARPHVGDRGTIRAMKQYTEQVLTQHLLGGPVIRRAYEKPLGYPGDYATMMYIYGNAPEGKTAFDRVMHKLACEEPLAEGVRTRKDYIWHTIDREHARVHEQRGADAHFRVMSIGCGPAMEVREYSSRPEGWSGRVHWLLVDQEQQALSLAYGNTYRALAESPGDGEVQCLYVTFQRFLQEPEMLQVSGPQDLIYCAGMFDYLREEAAQRLIAVLVDSLAPGGKLLLGNACHHPTSFWHATFLLDWMLLYRSEQELLQLADPVRDRVEATVEREPAGAYDMLHLRRR